MGKYKREEPLEMFEIAGENYYFDLEELSSFIRIEHDETVEDILNEAKKDFLKENEGLEEKNIHNADIIDFTKWETTKVMMECILSEHGPVDEAMGFTKLSNQLSIPFKISFNTLLKHKIIKK
jgi:hypothetical protein